METQRMVTIQDCRNKETLTIRRIKGDFEIRIEGKDGIFASWFELKRPAKENYVKIEKHFLEIRKLLRGQDLE